MGIANAAQSTTKTVSDPNAEYETLKAIWLRCRAVCSGERYVKDVDAVIDVVAYSNLLIPFSPSMSQAQYNFYKAEAELPGIVSQFSKMLVGGLLRKQPVLKLPDGVPAEAHDWIQNEFGADDCSLLSYLDESLLEEIQTSRAWLFVDFPKVEDPDKLTPEELKSLKPYPILQKAESIINWSRGKTANGKIQLKRVIVRGLSEAFTEEQEFHPVLTDTVWVHELDTAGQYQIRVYQPSAPKTNVAVVAGQKQTDSGNAGVFELVDTITDIHKFGERLTYIPAWPLNGDIDLREPILSALIDKEVSLYNKMSRRNHLLYGAATYTPVIAADITDEQFREIVAGGLGTWIKLPENGKADALKTPTEALVDMDRSIAATIEEMAKLGIRMLSPETAQSGIALEIRNASQTAQLGTLNSKVCGVLKQVIAHMLNVRYNLELKATDIELTLSEDFNPAPLGADWLRLATEWYQQGLIPRSVWLRLLKQNEMVETDYDDEKGQEEILEDESVMSQHKVLNESYTNTNIKPPPDTSVPGDKNA
jgi:hypothetical protein